jgi:hypothetical protein
MNRITDVEVSGIVVFVTVIAIEKKQSEAKGPVIAGCTFRGKSGSLKFRVTFAIEAGGTAVPMHGSIKVTVIDTVEVVGPFQE